MTVSQLPPCCFRDLALEVCNSFIFGGEIKKELSCPTRFLRPSITKRRIFKCGCVTVHQPSGLTNNVLSKRCSSREQQGVILFQLRTGTSYGIHSCLNPPDLVLDVRQDHLDIRTNYRPQSRHSSLSFVDMRIKCDLRSQGVVPRFATTSSRLFQSKSEGKHGCRSCGDGCPCIPVDNTGLADPPALAYSVNDAHPELLSWCCRHFGMAYSHMEATACVRSNT